MFEIKDQQVEDLKGKVVVITGGSKGIGKGIAIECARKGAKLMITALDKGPLKETAESLRATGAQVAYQFADSTSKEDWTALVAKTQEVYGGQIDYVFSNAGISFNKTLLSATADEWNWIMNVNFLAHLKCLGAVLPVFIEQETGGRFVFTASYASFVTPPTMVPYACSKAATMALAEGLHNEMTLMGMDKVRVSIIMPAYVATNIQHNEASRPESVKDLEATSNEMDRLVWEKVDSDLNSGVLGTISLETAGERIINQVEKGRFYIYTHCNFAKTLMMDKAQRMLLDKPPVEPGTFVSEYYASYPEEF